MGLKLGQIACNADCDCADICQIFTGDATEPCTVHVPYSAQIEHTGNSGSDAEWTCCDEVNDVNLGQCEGCYEVTEANGLPFAESDIRCCIDYGFQFSASQTGFNDCGGASGDCTPITGYISAGRSSGCVFVQRESTGHVYLGVAVSIAASTTGFSPCDFEYRLIGWTDLGAGPIDPTSGPWSVTSFAVDEGDKCWDVTPGTITITLTDEAP